MQIPCLESQACQSVFCTDSNDCTVLDLGPPLLDSGEQRSVIAVCTKSALVLQVNDACRKTVLALCCQITISHCIMLTHGTAPSHRPVVLILASSQMFLCVSREVHFGLSRACYAATPPLVPPRVVVLWCRQHHFLIAVDHCYTISATLLLLHRPCCPDPRVRKNLDDVYVV